MFRLFPEGHRNNAHYSGQPFGILAERAMRNYVGFNSANWAPCIRAQMPAGT